MLLECSVGLSMDTAEASLTLCDVRTLGNRNRYFVDVSQWKQTLKGAESVALIPVICRAFHSYSVNVCLSGVTVAYLYQELGSAIQLQQFPDNFWPLTSTKGTTVSGYNERVV